jgi:hypothetical protein
VADHDPQNEPFAPPYVLNQSSVVVQNDDQAWPVSSPPPVPPSKPRRWRVAVVIIAVLALVGGLVVAGIAEIETIAQRASAPLGNNDDPLAGVPDAPPGSDEIPTERPTPIAAVCPPTCFTVASAGLLLPNGSLEGSLKLLGPAISPDFQHPTTAGAEYATSQGSTSGPPACFFLVSRSPLASTDASNADPVTFLGQDADDSDGSTLSQSARFFPTSAAADAYLRGEREQAESCQLADHSVGSTPSFDVPAPLTINAYAQISGTSRTYVYDIQRANVVVRFRVVSTDSLDESSIVHFLHTWATTDLAQLDVN